MQSSKFVFLVILSKYIFVTVGNDSIFLLGGEKNNILHCITHIHNT